MVNSVSRELFSRGKISDPTQGRKHPAARPSVSSIGIERLVEEKKGNVFYGQKLTSGKSTTTECGVNY